MTESEKLLRITLERWLKLFEKQQRCEFCSVMNHQCATHPRQADELNRLAEQTRKFLAAAPN